MLGMVRVGTDRRISYYQMAGKEVIADLRSHPYGLTHPEAKRRREQNGFNRLDYDAKVPIVGMPAVHPWFVGLLILGGILAWFASDQVTAVGLATSLFVALMASIWRESRQDTLTYRLRQLLPARSTVRRNDVAEIIPSSELVIGDIVELQPGDQIPADLRLLEVDNLCVDDLPLFGSHTKHVYKFSHPLASDVPLSQRHNLAFAGTSVVHGSGVGIVTAAGMQTELGQIYAQAAVTGPKTSYFDRAFSRYSRRFAVVALVLLSALGVLTATNSLDIHAAVPFALALIVALTPVELPLAATLLFRNLKKHAKRSRTYLSRTSASDQLGETDILLIDETDFIIGQAHAVSELLVGKTIYKPDYAGYSPTGKIWTEKGKPVGSRRLAELRLVFDAMVLSTRARLLPPDSDYPEWHVAGPASEGALLSLAAKAGTDIDATRGTHSVISRHTYDQVRQLTSGLHEYGPRHLLFIHGSATAVLDRANRMWDGGHTRKMTASDRTRLQAYLESQAAHGNHTLALAYRQLPKTASASLDMDAAERNLILLGVVSIDQPVVHTAPAAVEAAQHSSVAVSLASYRTVPVALAVAEKIGLIKPTVITSDTLNRYDDTQLLELLMSGTAVFMHLTSEQRLRLADIVARSPYRLAVTGSSYSDIPILRHAGTGITGNTASLVVREQADVVLPQSDILMFMRTLVRSRHLNSHLQLIMHNALVDHGVQIWLIMAGIGLYLYGHIPLAITAPLLLVATLLQIVPFCTTDRTVNQAATKHVPDMLPPHSSGVNVALGMLAGLLICINFLFFFVRNGLSARYIDTGSTLYAQAITLTFTTLMLCLYTNLFFAHAQHKHAPHGTRLRTWRQRWAIIVSGLIVGLLIYAPLSHSILGTANLGPADWLCAVSTAVIYGAIRWLAHTSRSHSRHVLLAELLGNRSTL